MSKLTEELTPIIEFLGETNTAKIKDAITDGLIDNAMESIDQNWLVTPTEFSNQMEELLEQIGKKICKKYKGELEEAMEQAMLRVIAQLKGVTVDELKEKESL